MTLNLRSKIILPVIIGALVFMGYFHFIWSKNVLLYEQEHIVARNEANLALLDTQLSRLLLDSDLAGLHALLNKERSEHPFVQTLVLLNKSGRQVFPLEHVDVANNASVFSLHNVMLGGEVFGDLYVEIDMVAALSDMSAFLSQVEISLFIIVLIVVMAMMVVSTRLVWNPIVQLKKAANRVAKGDTSVALPVQSDGEIGGLAIAFEVMRRNVSAAQAKLEWALASAVANEVKQKAVVDSIIDGIVIADEHGVIESCNPAAEKIFGFSNEELIGHRFTMLMPKDIRDERRQSLSDYVSGWKSVDIFDTHTEVVGLHKDGTKVWLDHTISEIIIDGERKFLAVLRDITDAKEVHAQLLAAKEEAERASVAKSEFLSRMSHELRTPLNAILGFSQLLEMDTETLSDDQLTGVKEIHVAGDHLLTLINDVLNLAKIESGKLDVSIEDVVLGEIVHEAVMMVMPMMDKFGVRLVNYFDDAVDECHVKADRVRLKQVVVNLLSNAVKYNSEQGTLTIAVQPLDDAMLRVLISDTGNGMSEEQLARLFRPFERLGAENGVIEGTGIGLVIAKKFMQKMNGDVGVSSQPGQGSTFWIDVPLYISDGHTQSYSNVAS